MIKQIGKKTHEDSEKTDSDDSSSGVESVSSEESSIADNELNCKYAKYQTQKGHEGESAAYSSADLLSGAKDQKGDFLCSSDDSFSGVESILKDNPRLIENLLTGNPSHPPILLMIH